MFLRWLRAVRDPGTTGSGIHDMKPGLRTRGSHRGVVFAVAVILIFAHGTIFYYVALHTTVSAALFAGVIVLVVVKHLGFLAPLYTLFRRSQR